MRSHIKPSLSCYSLLRTALRTAIARHRLALMGYPGEFYCVSVCIGTKHRLEVN